MKELLSATYDNLSLQIRLILDGMNYADLRNRRDMPPHTQDYYSPVSEALESSGWIIKDHDDGTYGISDTWQRGRVEMHLVWVRMSSDNIQPVCDLSRQLYQAVYRMGISKNYRIH